MVWSQFSINPNKAKIFEDKFLWEGEGCQFDLLLFIFQEALISDQHNFTQLLKNLFKVC